MTTKPVYYERSSIECQTTITNTNNAVNHTTDGKKKIQETTMEAREIEYDFTHARLYSKLRKPNTGRSGAKRVNKSNSEL